MAMMGFFCLKTSGRIGAYPLCACRNRHRRLRVEQLDVGRIDVDPPLAADRRGEAWAHARRDLRSTRQVGDQDDLRAERFERHDLDLDRLHGWPDLVLVDVLGTNAQDDLAVTPGCIGACLRTRKREPKAATYHPQPTVALVFDASVEQVHRRAREKT